MTATSDDQLPQDPTLWATLHDGYFAEVSAPRPSTLHLRVRILYLAERLTPPAEAVRITLHGVIHADYTRWGAKHATPLIELIDDQVAIVGAVAKDAGILIHNGEGELYLQYDHATLTDDNHRPLSLATLRQTAKSYWADFSKRT